MRGAGAMHGALISRRVYLHEVGFHQLECHLELRSQRIRGRVGREVNVAPQTWEKLGGAIGTLQSMLV